jgi:antitoxin MazE
MAEAHLGIKKWGNSLGVRLPAAIAREANLEVDQRVNIRVESGSVVITPEPRAAMSLGERLAQYDAGTHGGEVMPADPVGNEVW